MSSRSASLCLRMTWTACRLPSSVREMARVSPTRSSPSRSRRATVSDTVGLDCSKRSTSLARNGTTPSS